MIISHQSYSKISKRRKIADESENEDNSVDSKHELSMLNGEVSMLQDENDELREENENLIMQIDNITFQFEAELEKLNIENKELEFKLLRSGIFKF